MRARAYRLIGDLLRLGFRMRRREPEQRTKRAEKQRKARRRNAACPR
jgi:hypothetical protein